MHTAFYNEKFITDKYAQSIWNKCAEIWWTVYVGYPTTMRLDCEASFDSATFRNHAVGAGIDLQFSSMEKHNSTGIGER